ncbi:MAG: nucleotidyltransferase domain-containing protein [Candidatus Paceibacteria bacterium]
MDKTKNRRQEIKSVVDQITAEFDPEKIFLFGSYAWGSPDEESDVDLIIVAKTDEPKEMAREIDGSIYPRPFPMDVIVYTPDQFNKKEQQGSLFIENVLTEGQELYARK